MIWSKKKHNGIKISSASQTVRNPTQKKQNEWLSDPIVHQKQTFLEWDLEAGFQVGDYGELRFEDLEGIKLSNVVAAWAFSNTKTITQGAKLLNFLFKRSSTTKGLSNETSMKGIYVVVKENCQVQSL